MNGDGSDACQCFDVFAEQGRASIFIDGEAGHAVDVLDVGNMQLADFFDPHTGIKRNPRCPELGRLSFRSLQITGSVTEERVQFVMSESGSPGSFAANILVGHSWRKTGVQISGLNFALIFQFTPVDEASDVDLSHLHGLEAQQTIHLAFSYQVRQLQP